VLAISANVVGAWFAAIVAFWKGHYFVPGAAFAFGFGIILLLPLIAIALSRLDEIAAIAFGRPPRRLACSPPLVPEAFAPKVSIHIPACCEPPDMIKATLDAVALLDYPNVECVVVINNTPDPALWLPVEEHCRALGERFKFVNIEKLAGYKAGALRVRSPIRRRRGNHRQHRRRLRRRSGLAERPGPAIRRRQGRFVQSPQDHRDGGRSLMHYAMNAEYAGFFDIGMVQRNEVNAIVMHGTMCLIRRVADRKRRRLVERHHRRGHRSRLAMLEQGWIAHYSNRRYGHGLLPDTFDAYKRQRYRWAFGGFQLLRKHWRRMLPGAAGLTHEQKREYGIGWLTWMGSDSIGVVVALLNILWSRWSRSPYRGAGSHPDDPDHRGLRRRGRPFRYALPAAGPGISRSDARRGLCGHVDGNGRSRALSAWV